MISEYSKFLQNRDNLNSLVSTLVNSMDDQDEMGFAQYCVELGLTEEAGKKIFNDYWKVAPSDRFTWDHPEWSEWLTKTL